MTFVQSPTKFDGVIEWLETVAEPTKALDRAIYGLVTEDDVLRDRLREQVHATTHRFTAGMDAWRLIPLVWWWHCSHLGASVVPCQMEPDIPISNAVDYINGRPLRYFSDLRNRETVPHAIAAAALKAHRALYLKRLAIDTEQMYLLQTGDGPRLVTNSGQITELPRGMWLDETGQLVAREIMFPVEV